MFGINWGRLFQVSRLVKLVLLALPFIVWFGAPGYKRLFESSSPSSHCYTKDCISTFKALENIVDLGYEPCDNWHEYICGGLSKPTLYQTSPMKEIENKMKDGLKRVVTGYRPDEGSLTSNVLYMRKFYHSCVASKPSSVHRGRKKYNPKHNDGKFMYDISCITSGWPTYGMDNEQSPWTQWTTLTLHANRNGYFHGFFLDVNVKTDLDTGKSLLRISPPSLEEFNKFDYFWSDHQNIRQLLLMLDSKANYELFLLPIMRKEFKEIIETANKVKKMVFETTTISKMSKKDSYQPTAHWMEFLISLTNNTALTPTSHVVYELEESNYLKNLRILWRKYGSRIWLAYVATELLLRDCDLMGPKFLVFCNLKVTQPPIYNKYDPNWDNLCYEQAKTYFPGFAEAQYIRDQVTINKRSDVKIMISRIADQIQHSLRVKTANENFQILTDFIDNVADNFLTRIVPVVGGTDIVFDVNEFEREFRILETSVASDDFFKFRHVMTKSLSNYNFRTITRSAKQNLEFNLFVSKINLTAAYYETSEVNREGYMYISPALLQMPIYSLQRGSYLNYGALGSIISNALLQGLGRILASPDVLTTNRLTISMAYLRLTVGLNGQRITQRYLLHKHDGDTYVDWSQVGADFNAADVAYQAYEKHHVPFETELPLAGFEGTNSRHLFWMMSSFYMCQPPEYESVALTIRDLRRSNPFNYYTVPSFRINKPKTQSVLFLRDFACDPTQRMNQGDCEYGLQICPQKLDYFFV